MDKKDSTAFAGERGRTLEPMGLVAAGIVWLTLATRWWVPIQDPDLWWLMWAGDQIAAGHFPFSNLGSYTAPEAVWVLHEPLVALIYSQAGASAVGWLRCLVLGTTALLMLTISRGRSGWSTALALLPMPVLMYFSLSERAVAWGMMCLAGMVWLLERRDEPKRFRLAVGLIVVWANLHGSFVLGVLLLASWSWRWGALGALGALLNPNGWSLYGLIGKYGVDEGVRGAMGNYIAEWAPLNPWEPSQAVAMVWLIGAVWLVGMERNPRKILLTVLVGALMVRAWRFAPVAAIVTLPWVVDALDRRVPYRPLGRPHGVLTGLLVFNLLMSGSIEQKPGFFPEEFRDELSVDERIWHDHLYGGWLLYNGFEVFWDGRNDCYPASVFDEGLRVVTLAHGWEKVLDGWDVDVVLTRRPLLVDELGENGWRVRKQVGEIVLLERNERSS